MSTLQWKIYIHTHLKYISSSSFSCGTLCICKWLPQGITIIQTMPTMHFFWDNFFDKMWYLFLSKYLFCLYREFSSGNLTNREKSKQFYSDNKDEKNRKKHKWFSGYLDDTFEQTGSHSAQEIYLDGLSEWSSSSEKVESDNGYEISQHHCKSLLYKQNGIWDIFVSVTIKIAEDAGWKVKFVYFIHHSHVTGPESQSNCIISGMCGPPSFHFLFIFPQMEPKSVVHPVFL